MGRSYLFVTHLKHCKNYYAMDRCFYNYVQTPNSLSHWYCLDLFKIILANFRHYREMFEDRFDFDTQYANDYRARSIESMIFRSLEQKENREIIRGNILDVLQNEEVRGWFAQSNPRIRFQSKIKKIIISGGYQKALRCFKRKLIRKKLKESQRLWLYKMKRMIKEMLGMI